MAGSIDLKWHDDGLLIPTVREWSKRKYRLAANYNRLFSTGMKNKWKRVYIDLFAGAGVSRYKENNQIVKGSPLLSLDVEDKFDKYIFCENQPDKAEALRKRINKLYSDVDCSVIEGDCNSNVESILNEIPHGRDVLCFCFVDPYKLSSLKFSTIERLSRNRRMDFMILYPSYMEIRRWQKLYLREEYKTTIENFLDIKDWRKEWRAAKRPDSEFVNFIAEKFGQKMINIGYLRKGLDEMVKIKMRDGNRILYHLAFYSKNELGYNFWKAADTYGDEQININF